MILRHVELVGEDGPARDIALSGRVIARVGEPAALASRDGPSFDFGEAIAFPGLINSHDHLEYDLYPPLGHGPYADYVEWGLDIQRRDGPAIAAIERVPRQERLRWGALKNVLCGVTTVAHHGDSRDDLANPVVGIVPATSIHSARFARLWRVRLNSPVNRSPCVFHVGEGVSSEARREIDEILRWNLLRRPLVGVHAIAMRPDQAAHFRAIVWCPVSNEFLYRATADVASLKQRTTVLFGTDSTLTGHWSFWSHLRRARALGGLTDRELFESITSAAAVAWRLSRKAWLAAGATADVVVARKKLPDRWDAFFAVEPEDILLVVRDGRVVLCDASLSWSPGAGAFSSVRLGAHTKVVAEDAPGIVAAIRRCGVQPNLPIAVDV